MQSVSFWIWTRVAVSISYDANHYTTGTSFRNTSTIIPFTFAMNMGVKSVEVECWGSRPKPGMRTKNKSLYPNYALVTQDFRISFCLNKSNNLNV